MRSASLDGLLSLAAEQAPEGPAIVDRGRSITYGELEQLSSRVAGALAELGVGPGERVGLYLEKSIEALAGIYGVLKAGATYVPLDDQAPLVRLGYIARDAGLRCLISTGARAAEWQGLRDEGAPLEAVIAAGELEPDACPAGLRVLPWAELQNLGAEAPGRRVDPDALAYVLYTSGSTGEPKGVMLSHRNGLHFVDWAAREVGVGGQDRLSSHAPLHFDLSTFDLYAAAWGAAPVVLVPREASVFPIELARFIREEQISVWYSVPSILTQLALRGGFETDPPSRLRTIIFAGEVFPVKYLRRLMELVPHARFLNFYGPTETNVCTWYEVPRDGRLGESLPIGRPIPGVRARVEDESGALAAGGTPGELIITGPTVMHGYWGDAQRTARTLSGQGTERTYRTGDLVREDDHGELEFIGRRDSQVKTRGYRVELGEIETALNALDAVVECAVVAIPDEAITNRLRAYVVTRTQISTGALAGACRQRLPRYMIPDEFELREELPKSSTGKIDRRALPRS